MRGSPNISRCSRWESHSRLSRTRWLQRVWTGMCWTLRTVLLRLVKAPSPRVGRRRRRKAGNKRITFLNPQAMAYNISKVVMLVNTWFHHLRPSLIPFFGCEVVPVGIINMSVLEICDPQSAIVFMCEWKALAEADSIIDIQKHRFNCTVPSSSIRSPCYKIDTMLLST